MQANFVYQGNMFFLNGVMRLSVLSKIEKAGWIGGPCSTTFLRSSIEGTLLDTFVEVLSRHAGNSVFGSYVRIVLQAQYFVQLANCWQVRVGCCWRSSRAALSLPAKRAARRDQFAWHVQEFRCALFVAGSILWRLH